VQGLLYLHAVRTMLPNAQVVLAYDRLKAGKRVRFVPNTTQLVQRFNPEANWEDSSTASSCCRLTSGGKPKKSLQSPADSGN
jgi:hypothetical protein